MQNFLIFVHMPFPLSPFNENNLIGIFGFSYYQQSES